MELLATLTLRRHRLLLLYAVVWLLLPAAVKALPVPEPTAQPSLYSVEEGICLEKYAKWKQQKYTGKLAYNPTFWIYQTQTEFVLTNGLALDLAVAKCTQTLKDLKTFRSGRTGPVEVQYAYKAMCTPYCLQCDIIHEDALKFTGCSCAQLSTQSVDPSFHVANDWCSHNSGRLLCDILGFCGIWNCRIDDFMCPRHEWNKKIIPLKGVGSCLRHQVAKSDASSSSTINYLVVCLTTALGLLINVIF